MKTSSRIEKLEQPCFSNKVLKAITLFLFFLLPSRISRIFVSLSIISAIYTIREDSSYTDRNVIDRIGEILKVHLTDQILLLPQQTLSWYWTPAFFDNCMLQVNGRTLTIREAITDKDDFVKYRNQILNCMLDALPKSFQRKLKLSDRTARMDIKQNIFNAVAYA